MTLPPSLRRAEVDDVSKRLLQTRTHAQAASRGHSLGVISSSAAESTDEILPTALDSLSHRHMSVSDYLGGLCREVQKFARLQVRLGQSAKSRDKCDLTKHISRQNKENMENFIQHS